MINPINRVVSTGMLSREELILGDVPWTKPEVRAVTLSKLDLLPYHRVLDIGAGSGTVTLEIARRVMQGAVVAIEEREQACALELAMEGKTVALISSGDAGVYGMAGLIYELIEQSALDIEVEVIPGITAILAAAAELGAPLMQDFAAISLSDLMTPWETIRQRLHAAGQGDFVIGIYNPRSKKRQRQLIEAQKILLQYRSPSTPVGIIWNGTRSGQRKLVTTLFQIPIEEVDMFATLIIGNSETYSSRGRMITPRGYLQRNRSGGEDS